MWPFVAVNASWISCLFHNLWFGHAEWNGGFYGIVADKKIVSVRMWATSILIQLYFCINFLYHRNAQAYDSPKDMYTTSFIKPAWYWDCCHLVWLMGITDDTTITRGHKHEAVQLLAEDATSDQVWLWCFCWEVALARTCMCTSGYVMIPMPC